MKLNAILSLPLVGLILIIYGFGGNAKWPGGSPGGYTGSPGDGKDCTHCHGGTATQVTGWITSDIPAEGYIPGETYTINISVTGAGDKGFEVSPQNLQGDLLGTLIDGPGIHLVAGNTAVTQDDATSANPATWQFEWTAPDAGTGGVTFYGAFTVNKPVTKLSTYTAQENTGVKLVEHERFTTRIYPNPASEYIHIHYWAEDAGTLAIDLISLQGTKNRIIEESIVAGGLSIFDYTLPSGLDAGLYILQISTATGSENFKLIVK